MKVGDLVRMCESDDVLGIVVSVTPPDALIRKKPSWYRAKTRVGIAWSDDGGNVVWEPSSWLEVISESR